MSPRRTTMVRLAVATSILAIVSGAGYGYSQRNVHRVSIRPGEATSITVEVPMQRFGRTKSFAKEANLPVDCDVSAPSRDQGGVRVTVAKTDHSIHILRARLRVAADPGAPTGRTKRSVDFTIDDEGGWPTAIVVVDVKHQPY
ncbi:MAG: hypothetical protein ACYTAU_00295 [Planctomycetota bacterium]